ncbi:MAG: hypothetical protein QOJ72_1754 [Nocardioidaceae bacterium]|nr:hypothetical protein [Nocardioidaceae bacterium]
MPLPRRTSTALGVFGAFAAGVIALLLLTQVGDHPLALLCAGILLVLVAHTLRSEQQSRRIHRRLDSVERIARDARSSVAALDRIETSISDTSQKKGLIRELTKMSRRSFEQVQATINLFEMFEVDAYVPPMRVWAVSPDAVSLLVEEMLDVRPTLVVECGSGTSTMWLALAAKQRGLTTRIVALDHSAEYAAKTNRLLERHGVADIAVARVAPLVDVIGVDGTTQKWYDPAAIQDLDGIGLLFVDGPPATVGSLARFPALPHLWSKLTPAASIVMDDMIRKDEREIVDLWVQAHPELRREHYTTEKRTEILRRRPA